MKRTPTTRGAVTLVATAGVTVMLSGVSYAFWTTTGTGSATATSGKAEAVNVTVAVAGGNLYPGGKLSVIPTFSNPNPFAVTVTSVTPTAVTVSGAAGCTATNSGVTFTTLNGTWVVPAKTGSQNSVLTGEAIPGAVSMASSSDTSCQTATFTATLTVAGSSS